jgi:hypothetical protein
MERVSIYKVVHKALGSWFKVGIVITGPSSQGFRVLWDHHLESEVLRIKNITDY